jgi:hypothetical protein
VYALHRVQSISLMLCIIIACYSNRCICTITHLLYEGPQNVHRFGLGTCTQGSMCTSLRVMLRVEGSSRLLHQGKTSSKYTNCISQHAASRIQYIQTTLRQPHPTDIKTYYMDITPYTNNIRSSCKMLREQISQAIGTRLTPMFHLLQ